MMVLEYGSDVIIIDAGSMFPDEEMFGVDLVIPDISYLSDKKQTCVASSSATGTRTTSAAYRISPGTQFPPLYGTRLTQGLINVKLKEHRLLEKVTFNVVAPGDRVKLGACEIEVIRINHSIPDATALAIHTPLAWWCIRVIINSITPRQWGAADFGTLARLGNEGVLIAMADSTRVESPGYTPSERVLNDTLISSSPTRPDVSSWPLLPRCSHGCSR